MPVRGKESVQSGGGSPILWAEPRKAPSPAGMRGAPSVPVVLPEAETHRTEQI